MNNVAKISKMSALAILGLALGAATATLAEAPARRTGPEQSAAPAEALRYAQGLSTAFENAAAVIQPSVVTVKAVKHFKPAQHHDRHIPLPEGQAMPWGDELLHRFFGEQAPRMLPPQHGVGSGVIVSSDGYILTNNHVVDGADEVTVTRGDGHEWTAKVVGSDPMSDLAVLQVDDKNLPAATLGDSDSLRIGEWVVAAGNPFGLSNTITAGIVSAKGRSNVRIAEYEDFIQTDAAINPGNSGGPLIDLNGRVVGINTAIASHNGGSDGVGFAIPVNMARSVMDSLIRTGEVVRGWLGVAIQPLDEAMARSFGYDSTAGALVGDVVAGGPAEKAGLKAGDIVTRYGNTKLVDVQQLRNLTAATEPGTRVAVEVIRDGRPQSFTVEIAHRESEVATAGKNSACTELGMTVTDLTPETAESLNLSREANGAVVTQVDPGSLADMAGIAPGSVIMEVQGQTVKDAAQFRSQLSKHDLKSGVRLLVQSGDLRRFVLLQTKAA
jgi:serine protease Do